MTEKNDIFQNISADDILKFYSDIIETPEDTLLASACGGAQAAGCSSCVYSGSGSCK